MLPEDFREKLKDAALLDGRGGFGRQKGVLMEARNRGDVPFTAPNPERAIGHGGEHDVELSEDGGRVIKHTREGRFGYIPVLNQDGRIIGVPASAYDYVQRMEAHETLFPTELRFEGIHGELGGGFTISQTHYSDAHPGLATIWRRMQDAGFKKSPLGATAWFNPSTHHLINDAKSENFRQVATGTIVPVDLQITKAEPGSALHKALMGSLGK
jgi:hypothetical protein